MVENKNEEYKVIFIIGPPGAGKNTLCDKLKVQYKFVHFGAGDLLREEISKETETGRKIKEIIKEGNIVPVKITCGLIKDKMDSYGKDNIFLIDGYPRNKDNIDGFNEVFDGSEGRKAKIICLLNLDCSEETCLQRLLNRGVSSGRIDDEESVIKKRFNTYRNESAQVIGLMKSSHVILNVSSEDIPEKVYENAKQSLSMILDNLKKD